MTKQNDDVVAALSKSYDELRPLLEYLRARLKYDTIRWLRTCGTKDDVIFSTRIKTFERVHDKLVRSNIHLTKSTKLIDIILSGAGTLDDLIGIRFICFDAFIIFRLVQYFLTTERVTTSNREVYISSRATQDSPIHSYLASNGFKTTQKQGREYEDINFIMRFSHPIDQFFGSGLEKFSSLAKLAGESTAGSDRLAGVDRAFNELKKHNEPLISYIQQFPIECQMVTATQHIYNRTQRPHYEYILQRKPEDRELAQVYIEDLNGQLGVLKTVLIAADQSVFQIHKKTGIRYQQPLQIKSGRFFGLSGRLPRDILVKNGLIEEINDLLLQIIEPGVSTQKREKIFKKMIAGVGEINRAIQQRAKSHKDIAAFDLLTIADLEKLSHPEIVFWCYQRLVILSICILLLYTPDPEITKQTIAALRFASKFANATSSGLTLSDPDIVIGRLFLKLEQMDHAISTKLMGHPRKISGWKEGYFALNTFADPLVQWRHATQMYSKREYKDALDKLKLGIAVYEQLEWWKNNGVPPNFEIPERVLFDRRIVEYELCLEMINLRFTTSSVAGMLEFCKAAVPRQKDWSIRLQKVVEESADITEQARCFCFQVLLRLCSISAGGPSGMSFEILKEELLPPFTVLEKKIARTGGANGTTEKSWWLLTSAIMRPDASKKALQQFHKKIEGIQHHPLERIQFEKLCARLIELWTPALSAENTRKEFSVNLLTMLDKQTEQFCQSAVLSEEMAKQIAEILQLTKEAKNQLANNQSIQSHPHIQEKLTHFLADAAEQFVIDVVVSGLRNILGI